MKFPLCLVLVILTTATAVNNPSRVAASIVGGLACAVCFAMCQNCFHRRDAAAEARRTNEATFFHFTGLAFGFVFLVYTATMICGMFYGLPVPVIKSPW